MLSKIFFAAWLALMGWTIRTDQAGQKRERANVVGGPEPCLLLVNRKPFPIFVSAEAYEVDSQTRYVGFAPPEDSALMHIPYGDTTVRFILSGPNNKIFIYLLVDSQKCYRLEITRGDSTSAKPMTAPGKP